MTRFTRRMMTGLAALTLTVSAFGQWRRDDDRYRDDGYYGRGGGGDDYRRGGYRRGTPPLIERVISHLDGAGYYGQSGGDRRHLERARNDLYRFRENWYRGRFDRGRLDSAIDHIHHVVDSRWIHPRERAALSRDLYDLRDFRAGGGYENRGRYPW